MPDYLFSNLESFAVTATMFRHIMDLANLILNLLIKRGHQYLLNYHHIRPTNLFINDEIDNKYFYDY